EHVPAPRARGWTQGGVRQALKNPVYVGELVWGKVKTTIRRGREVLVPRPESEWRRFTNPALAIVDADLWARVQARRESQRRSIPRCCPTRSTQRSPRGARSTRRPSTAGARSRLSSRPSRHGSTGS